MERPCLAVMPEPADYLEELEGSSPSSQHSMPALPFYARSHASHSVPGSATSAASSPCATQGGPAHRKPPTKREQGYPFSGPLASALPQGREGRGRRLHCRSESAQSSPARSCPLQDREGHWVGQHSVTNGAGSKDDAFKQLKEVVKGSLTYGNIDLFSSAYARLRAQVQVAAGGDASTPADIRLRALLADGAAVVESAFRRALEEQTRAVDASCLVRCMPSAGDSEGSQGDLAKVAPCDTEEQPPSQRPSPVPRDEEPNLGARDGPQLAQAVPKSFSESVRTARKQPSNQHSRILRGLETLGMMERNGSAHFVPENSVPTPDEQHDNGGDSSSGRPSLHHIRAGSLPEFPVSVSAPSGALQERLVGALQERLVGACAQGGSLPACPARDHSCSPSQVCSGSSSPHAEVGARQAECEDVEVPGAIWEESVGHEARLLATGGAVSWLRCMAKAMVDCCLEDACLQAYKDVRSTKVESSLRAMGIGPCTRADAERLSPGQADECVKGWKWQMAVALCHLLPAERKLCEQCLGSAPWLVEQAFLHLGREAFALLFPVAEALAESSKTEGKLVILLDLYEALVDVRLALDDAFTAVAGSHMRSKAESLTEKLKKAVKEGFRRLKSFIENQAPEEVPDDVSYPRRGLVTYIMQIITILSSYRAALEDIFQTAFLKESLEEVLGALESHINQQAQQYEDPAQSEFFVMNNFRYIACTMKNLSFAEVLGRHWIDRQHRKVQRHGLAYQKLTWVPVIALLNPSSATPGAADPPSPSVDSPLKLIKAGSSVAGSLVARIKASKLAGSPKDKLDDFSQAVGRVHLQQRCWHIPDQDLREYTIAQLSQQLLDRYRAYADKHRSRRAGSKHQATGMTEEALQTMVRELFSGYVEGDSVPTGILAN